MQKPFLDGTEHLTEDVVSVFPAADSLEQYLLELMTSVCGDDTDGPYFRKLIPYEVRLAYVFTLKSRKNGLSHFAHVDSNISGFYIC